MEGWHIATYIAAICEASFEIYIFEHYIDA